MTNSDEAIREFQRKYAMKTYRLNPETLQREQTGYDVNFMIDLTALISEHYVAKEEHEKLVNAALQNKPQPTAEGAEEILTKHLGSLMPLKYGVKYNKMIDAMRDFAAIHAQRIADKKYADTEADGYVFCGKCGKMKEI